MRAPIIALKDKRADRGQHAGLLLQRYLCKDATGDKGNPEEKRAILAAAIKAAASAEVRALYEAAYKRWTSSLPDDAKTVDLATEGRLIVGLGSENVIETALTLHHTYGMPIIPGSALKGLAAHYCDREWGQAEPDFKRGEIYHSLLFGTTDDSGCLVFHDAWLKPESPNPLVLDVMTPHHMKWNDVKNPVAPTDFDSPTPVPFLSVMGTFRVAVSWRGPEDEKALKWTDEALGLLKDALKEWGAGGKTSSGYGRLMDVKDVARIQVSGQAASGAKPTRSGPGGAVRVKFIGVHEKQKTFFWVQEEGKKRGLIKYGPVPDMLPTPDSEVSVYPTNDNPNSPEYRWDPPPPPNFSTRGSGGQRPRGRR